MNIEVGDLLIDLFANRSGLVEKVTDAFVCIRWSREELRDRFLRSFSPGTTKTYRRQVENEIHTGELNLIKAKR